MDIPDALHQQLKVLAARERTTLRALIVQAVQKMLMRDVQPEPGDRSV
ncbi:hypothetical protein GRAN_0998 [Granulicella sibirica]|uniref:CopG-like ribbon-helix-helix domain-containing protein n=1 Tax=Granulicella sibirica TaxID=2479048 RepID=A0A4Q0T6G0_9BACT|nr:hypothetical protein GRAN_0998 [Granulicella sibirica]